MKHIVTVFVLGIFPLILVNHAYAYIDPGTGSMIIQAAIAIVAAVSVSIGLFRQRLKDFFKRLFDRNKNE